MMPRESQWLNRGYWTEVGWKKQSEVSFHLPNLFSTQSLNHKSCIASLRDTDFSFPHSRVLNNKAAAEAEHWTEPSCGLKAGDSRPLVPIARARRSFCSQGRATVLSKPQVP